MISVNRARFVRVVVTLVVLLLGALVTAILLLPDQLARIAQLFLG